MIKLSVNKKIPERACVGCGNSFPKSTLIRVVKTPNGDIVLDFTGKVAGRGAYVCKNAECFGKAKKAKRFSRSLSAEISDELYDELERQVCENG